MHYIGSHATWNLPRILFIKPIVANLSCNPSNLVFIVATSLIIISFSEFDEMALTVGPPCPGYGLFPTFGMSENDRIF